MRFGREISGYLLCFFAVSTITIGVIMSLFSSWPSSENCPKMPQKFCGSVQRYTRRSGVNYSSSSQHEFREFFKFKVSISEFKAT